MGVYLLVIKRKIKFELYLKCIKYLLFGNMKE